MCTKNGAHCAFAHGTQDLRTPTYDVREMHAIERGESSLDTAAGVEMSTSMEKERILNDDPKWNGTYLFVTLLFDWKIFLINSS